MWQPHWPEGFETLVNTSYRIRMEIESGGGYAQTHTPYVPTDWNTTSGWKALLDGWTQETGTCPTCFTMRALSGACNCTD